MELTPYTIGYQINQTSIPTLVDYTALESFTNKYLNMYFQAVFRATPEIIFVSSATNITNSVFRLGEPVLVDYKTNITFSPLSTVFPNQKALDLLLMSAFEGTNGAMYTSALRKGLDPSNIFSTTSAITFTKTATKAQIKANSNADNNSTPQNTSNGQKPGLIAGMASAVFVMMIAGVALHRQRKAKQADVVTAKNLMQHMTADGESDTYLGDDRTQDTHSQAITKYRFDGESSVASSTVAEWGESPEDAVPHTAGFPMLVSRYNGEEDDSDESKEEEREAVEEELPETRRKRLDDVSL